MRDLYGVTFDLADPDAFEPARHRAISWALRRYPPQDPTATHPDVDGRLELGDVHSLEWWNLKPADGDSVGWWLAFRHPDQNDHTLAWRSAVEIVRDATGVHLTVRIGQESLEPVLRPAPDTPGRPRIVRDLADDLDGTADGVPVRSTPTGVRSDGVNGLVQLLLREDRRLPVVIVTPSVDRAEPLASPNAIADQLVGLAHVFAFQSSPATLELTAQIGRELSAYDGAIRVYWPGFGLTDDPYLHRLWLPHTVASIDEREGMDRHLLRLVGSISALRVPTDARLRGLQRQMDAAIREAERAEWARLREESQDIPDAFMDEFDKQSRRIEELEFEKDLLQEQVDDLGRQNEALSQNLSIVRLVQDPERDEVYAASPPESIREAVTRLEVDHPHAVVVLDTALDSADETRYRHLDRAVEALRAIGQVAQGWHDGSLATDFITAFSALGFSYAPVSDSALGVYAADYSRTYRGHSIQLRWHLKLGSGGAADSILRIYWHIDDDDKCFVLGHVGRHLRDSTTG